MKKDYNFSINEVAVDELKNTLLKNKQNGTELNSECLKLTKVLFSFANQNVMQQDFLSQFVTAGIDDWDEKAFETSCRIIFPHD